MKVLRGHVIFGLFLIYVCSVKSRRYCRSLRKIKLPLNTKLSSRHRRNHVTLQCAKGYYFAKNVNKKDILCRKLKNLSQDKIPKCRGCGEPPSLKKGFVKYTADSVGSVAVYSCQSGFSIKGSRKQRKCRRNLRWSGIKSRISCVKNTCRNPGKVVLRNGNVTFSDKLFEEFSTISFQCNEGYDLFGNEDIVCLKGKWSSKRLPFCTKKRCPKPDIPENGRLLGSNFLIGSTVEYYCNSGFNLYGSKRRSCQEDKTWNGTTAFCDDGRSYCMNPGRPSGTLKLGRSYNQGDKVRYRCKYGLKLYQGSLVRTCLKNRTWSGLPPQCVDEYFKVFPSVNETASQLSEGFVNSLLQTTCSGVNVTCPKQDARARALNLRYKGGLDLIFVLDTSSSISEENFKIARQFIKVMVKKFGIDGRKNGDGTHIACVTFGTRAEKQFNFHDASVNTLKKALKKINEIVYTRGGTATRLALDEVRKVILPSSKRKDTTKALFLITDGDSNIGGSPSKIADTLKTEYKVEIYVIGIGKRVKEESLREIASNDDNIFSVRDYDALKTVKRKIVNTPAKDKSFCGGTLINKEFVLTAAHCFNIVRTRPEDVKVVFQDRRGNKVFTSRKLHIHPDYNSINFKNDIALIRFPKLRRFSRKRQAICLPRQMNMNNIIKKENAMYAVGWGRTTPLKSDEKNNEDTSKNPLKQVRLPFKSSKFCEDKVEGEKMKAAQVKKDKWYFNNATQFCAGDVTGKNDACKGDSGGPSMVLNLHPNTGEWRWFQVGIISWGDGCAQEGEVGFYTKISAYLNWIDNIINS